MAGLGLDLLANTSNDGSISDTGIFRPESLGRTKVGFGSTFLTVKAVAAANNVAEDVVGTTDTETLAVVSTTGRGSAGMSWFDAGRSN